MSTGWLRGTVKEVLTGDTLIITGTTKSGPPPEKRISLSSLLAPKLGKRDGSSKDEAFAWQSREWLRKKCIGQPCVFKIDYVVDQISREFGSVFLGQHDNVAIAVAANGWAKVRESSGQVSPYLEELKKAEEQARLGSLGQFTKDQAALRASVRNVSDTDSSSFNAAAFLASVGKGKSVPAVVEQVLNGGTLRVLLLQDMRYATVVLAGVQAPSMGRRPPPGAAGAPATAAAPAAAAAAAAPAAAAEGEEGATNGNGAHAPAAAATGPSTASMLATGGQQGPDPFAREAKYLTESRVLNRDVFVVLEGVDKYSNLFATVLLEGEGGAKESIAEALVKSGFAKTVEWSLAMLMTGAQKLRELERTAKADKVGMWLNYVPTASNQTKLSDNFSGKVVEVVSGDCLVIRDPAAGSERRILLSSIRTPRVGTRDRQPEPWAQEAKEFLRKKLIGKSVDVTLEYVRKVPSQEGGPDRDMTFANVELVPEKGEEKQNVAEMVVARGFATIVKHRADEERSCVYERLSEVEEIAKANKKGLHSTKDAAPARVNDVSAPGQANRAKQYLPFFQRAGKMAGIVEYVLSGHRVKLNVPKEGVYVVFAPSGVRTPQRAMAAGNGKPAVQAEPFADEAIAFTREFAMQRDVEVVVEQMDRGGTFLGSLVIPNGPGGRPWTLATELLKVGLARLQPNIDPTRLPMEMQQAQAAAKAARLKIWQDWTPEMDLVADDDEEGGSGPSTGGGGAWGSSAPSGSGRAGGPEVLEVVVTEVVAAHEFYVQVAGEPRVQWVADQLAAMTLTETVIAPENVKSGSLVLAQFSLDKQWYRGYVERANARDGTYDIFFIDFGNRETVTTKCIKTMDAALAAVPGQAHLAGLAYLKVPESGSEYSGDARALLGDLIGGGRPLLASVVARERPLDPRSKHPKQAQGRMMLSLVDPDGNTNVAAQLLEAGLARLPKLHRLPTQAAKDAVHALQEFEDAAKSKHRGIFQYGDAGDSEDDGEIERRVAAAARRERRG